MKYFMAFLSCGFLFLAACSETEDAVDPKISLPTPTLEDAHPIPNSDATYYMHWDSFEEDRPSAEGQTLLREMLESGIRPKDVWFPSGPTPCGAPGAVTIVVAELSEPDARILDVGFAVDPEEWWIINCGVAKLWHYSFE